MTYTEQLKEVQEFLDDAEARPTEHHGIVVEVTRRLEAALEALVRVEAAIIPSPQGCDITWDECAEAVQTALEGK